MAAKKYSGGKPRLHLIDPLFLDDMARVLDMGESKYGPANWMKGMPWSELVNSAKRHIAKIEIGQFKDDESGEDHAAHAACCLMMLRHYMRQGFGSFNDLRFAQEPFPLHEEPEMRVSVPPVANVQGEGLPLSPELVPGERPYEGAAPYDPHSFPTQARTLDGAMLRIEVWANRVIPNRTAEKALQKLVLEELPELLHGALDDPGEWADVLILVLDGMRLRGIDPIEAVHDKMAINEKREWAINERGVLQHVE